MRSRTKAATSIIAAASVAAVSAFTVAAADARELSRSDPKKAANYRLPTPSTVRRRAAPGEVWIPGSDIETPQMRATHALRDAPEAEIASRSPRTSAKQAAEAKTVIYLETVAPSQDGRSFKYTAWLADTQLRSFAEVAGGCQTTEMRACARYIYGRLTGSARRAR
jgi:hypothetical protein